MTYIFRNLPCSIEPDLKLWAISGNSEKMSGVLEWCHNSEDANNVLKRMRQDPSLTNLRAHPWLKTLTAKEGLTKILEEYGYKDLEEADDAEHWSSDTIVPGCCLDCGTVEDSCEPDATDNMCSECGKDKVMALIMLVMNDV